MQTVRVPQTLPVVLSRDEVARLIAVAPNLKRQTALSCLQDETCDWQSFVSDL